MTVNTAEMYKKLTIVDRSLLQAMILRVGLRPVLDAMAGIIQDHLEVKAALPLYRNIDGKEDWMILDDMRTAKANLQAGLF